MNVAPRAIRRYSSQIRFKAAQTTTASSRTARHSSAKLNHDCEWAQQTVTAGNPPISAQVLWHSRSIVVINKPSGLVCQSTLQEDDQMSAMLARLKEEYGYPEDLRTVHRLDRLTTGSLLFATSQSHAKASAGQFKRREVTKVYTALVRGRLHKKQGIIDRPLCVDKSGRVMLGQPVKQGASRNDKSTASKAPDASGIQTKYRVLAESADCELSLVSLELVGGHKHQLRVHLAKVLGRPIVGDTLYNPKDKEPFLYLHASSLDIWQFRQAKSRAPEDAQPTKRGGSRYRLKVLAKLPSYFVEFCRVHGVDIPAFLLDDIPLVDGVKASKECLV
ncbi:pseudouridine synthase [Cylindrobasidium torrendii FP15055 ss-10]|uniref:Pseudouridine synthase n=1 Tax=Cylindrobasidium torrendii FP15055 ss-10 TaxID=1314674 RepID=A0A0D7B8H7_9AGAR|nr:pseudouridine synthase [Cylindrobasidium torrendii FP15055 ss-10]